MATTIRPRGASSGVARLRIGTIAAAGTHMMGA